MPNNSAASHRGSATFESLNNFMRDQTQLLQCADCGAWVPAIGTNGSQVTLETQLDRRPRNYRQEPLKFRGARTYSLAG